ncbi:UDP-N-acetylglucosamine transferase subunit ALG14 homolog [Hyposmocoma kahamanoa]|uniref:UDP-N-acetylglucosamine transferase subunit ALG14 homolog n=1 Tax=Hyposmocoma kahamanoa TaxID=1477025 RepID=UPI000E6D5D63|nr:UDP-N-acetylglucosamine transferase subunit ALG14 homolog [Hyposmocoma kahamanoa]
MISIVLIVLVITLLLAAITLRALILIYQIFTSNYRFDYEKNSLRTILCIGSGGHTTELLRIAKTLDLKKYQPRLYIVADNDFSSEVKICEAEKSEIHNTYAISRIPRSRNVNQSYLSSIFSSLYSILYTIPVVYNFKPNIVLCNGPGTCIPVCVVAFILRCFFIVDCRIIFIESICRVRTMSLTGKILQFFADIVVVQWPQLRDVCFRAMYFGRLT